MNKVFTAGYSGHTSIQLAQAVNDLGAVLVDIRLNPVSQNSGWDGANLAKMLTVRKRPRYFHVPELGNVNHKTGGKVQLKDRMAGLQRVIELGNAYPLILLCGCQDFNSCHRKEVARLLAGISVHTEELAWPESVPSGYIKCLTLWQMHASLMFLNDRPKANETRGWNTNYRGPLVIHASKNQKGLRECWENPEIRSAMQAQFGVRAFADVKELLPFGALLGTVELIDVKRTEDARLELPERERTFGNYARGRFAWICARPKLLPVPVPYRGRQGLYDIEESLLSGSGCAPASNQHNLFSELD